MQQQVVVNIRGRWEEESALYLVLRLQNKGDESRFGRFFNYDVRVTPAKKTREWMLLLHFRDDGC